MSHQIKTLEEYLSVPLFERIKRRVELTTQGQRYLISIQEALNEVEAATRKLMTNPNSAVVNLSVAPAFLTRWLVPRMRKFQEQYPDTELRLTAAMGQDVFYQSDIDMAVYFGKGHWPELDEHLLSSAVTIPVCSPQLLENNPPIKKPKDLLKLTLLHVAKRDNEWRELLQHHGLNRLENTKNMTFSSTSLAVGAAMEGLGIALVNKGLAERELRYGQLVMPLDIELDTGSSFYLTYPKDRPLTQNMQDFRNWILQELEET